MAVTAATIPITTLFGLPTSIVGAGAIVAVVTAGVLYAVGIIQKVLQEKRKNKNDDAAAAEGATMFVIAALKEQIAVLEKRVTEQAAGLVAMGLRLEEVIKENKSLKDVLQGRDNQTQKFQEEGFKAMQQSAMVISTIATIEGRVNKILDIIEHREVVVTRLHEDIKDTLEKVKTEK